MRIIYYFSKKSGVRFFQPVRKEIKGSIANYEIRCAYSMDVFKKILKEDLEECNIDLIISHGGHSNLLIPRPKNRPVYDEDGSIMEGSEDSELASGFIPAMNKAETNLFKNDFVFAIACMTATSFGKEAINNGAISYLGYGGSIRNIFEIDSEGISKAVKRFYETKLKQIYRQTLIRSFLDFINKNYTVKQLQQRFAFNLEKQINELLRLSPEQITQKYNERIDVGKWKKSFPKIRIFEINVIQEVNGFFVVLGDENFTIGSSVKSSF